jgi:protease I
MKSILILVDELYEDLELWYPRLRLQEDGHKITIAGMQSAHTYMGKHGYPCKTDIDLSSVEESKFDALIIPGGYAPDKLRRYTQVLDLVRSFHTKSKPIAFICHAGWVPISAKILKGKKATSFKAIKDDMENAGALWEDSQVVIDQNLISSRSVDDLPHFAKAIAEMLKK